MILLIILLFFLLVACMHARPLPPGWVLVHMAVSFIASGFLITNLKISGTPAAMAAIGAVTLLTHNLIVLTIYRRKKGP